MSSEMRTTRSESWPPPWLDAWFILGRLIGNAKQRLLIHLPEISGLIDVAARLLRHSGFLLLTIHVPVAGLDCTGDRNVGRAQGLMALRGIVATRVALCSHLRLPVEIILVGRGGFDLTVPQQEDRISL